MVLKTFTINFWALIVVTLVSPFYASMAQVPFSCSSDAYQLVGNSSTKTSVLYRYNVNSGSRSVVANVGATGNGIGYNLVDNMLWGATADTGGDLIRIDATGAHTYFTIPNFPSANLIIGDITSDGYLFVYDNSSRYWVVDINPERSATYLKLVDPTNSYSIQTVAPFGVPISFSGGITSAEVQVADWAFNPVDQNFYTVNAGNPNAGGHAHDVMKLNPQTGVISALGRAAGGGIQRDEASFFGASFFDSSGQLFTFGNDTGKFYEINVSTYVTTLLSTSTPSSFNDGASCTRALLTSTSLSGIVYQDGNGLTDNIVNGNLISAIGGNNLFVSLVGTDNLVLASTAVSNGTFSFEVAQNTTYTLVLSNMQGTVGKAPPSTNMMNGVLNVGEHIGLSAGNDGALNGLSDGNITVSVSSENVEYVNFGLNIQPSVQSGTDPITYSNPGASERTPVPSALFVGTDTEDAAYSGNMLGRTVTLSPNDGGALYYDGVLVTGLLEITNFDPSLVAVDPTEAGSTSVSFKYAVMDNAGVYSEPATLTLNFSDPLPVKLVSFLAGVEQHHVLLSWTTSEEMQADRFEIQRRMDLFQWETVGSIRATNEGSALTHYSFIDKNLTAGIHYYRLRMVDQDGSQAYSRLVDARVDDEESYIYPNPLQNVLRLKNRQALEVRSVEIRDQQGRVVLTKQRIEDDALNVRELAIGQYILYIRFGDGSTSTYRFTKQD